MASKENQECLKKDINKGCWTNEEDKRLYEVAQTHGAKKWKTIAAIAGLNRCAKSCRLRWLNYLRPNIKRGNITDQEEDLILRLHKLLGNRWSLIAGRLPGRTDNEIKNYWNSHLSKRKNQVEPSSTVDIPVKKRRKICNNPNVEEVIKGDETLNGDKNATGFNIDGDDFFDFSNESPLTLEWVSKFLDENRKEVLRIC